MGPSQDHQKAANTYARLKNGCILSVVTVSVTARHREEMEMIQRLWIATIEKVKLKK
jgi:hypothetical protein